MGPARRLGPELLPASAAAAVCLLIVLATGIGTFEAWGINRTYGIPPAYPTWGEAGEAVGAAIVRWDSASYVNIAEDGYTQQTQTAWFPLYPLLTALIGAVVGSVTVGGILLSITALIVGLTLLYRLTELELGRVAASRVVWLLALSPTALFFPSLLTESLFLALTVGCVYAARTGHWKVAALVGGCAALTRNTGVLLLIPLVTMYLHGPRGEAMRRDLLWLLAIPAGLACYLAYCAIEFGDPLSTMAAQDAWNRGFHGPLSAAWYAGQDAWQQAAHIARHGGDWANVMTYESPTYWSARAVWEFGWVVFALVALIGVFRRLPLAYGLYAAAALAVPLTYPDPENPLASFSRYVLVIFPLYMWLAAATESRRRFAAVLALSVVGLILYTFQIANGRFV